MLIGEIDGNPVTYDASTDRATCKNIAISAERMIRAFESPLDREEVKLDLTLENTGYMGYTLGCFTVSPEKAQILINNLKNARNAKSKNSEQQRVEETY
jgi:hypothetical protein